VAIAVVVEIGWVLFWLDGFSSLMLGLLFVVLEKGMLLVMEKGVYVLVLIKHRFHTPTC
jgi:hypothetical protein